MGVDLQRLAQSVLPDFYGHARTLESQRAEDADGNPLPWLTYPAISFLLQLDFSEKSIFEDGCGGSTEFWSQRAKRVVSVEHDADWWQTVAAKSLPNAEVFCERERAYVEKSAYRAPHDVIVVDGRWRYDSAAYCVQHLSGNGMIIVDNSERYPAVTQLLRDHGLIQVDMIGHGPSVRMLWSTSLFLTRQFAFEPCGRGQPRYLPGMRASIEVRPEWARKNEPGSF